MSLSIPVAPKSGDWAQTGDDEQPGQRRVAICSLLLVEPVEERAPRGVEAAQRGMNLSQRAEGVRQRVSKAEFAIGCRGGFRV